MDPGDDDRPHTSAAQTRRLVNLVGIALVVFTVVVAIGSEFLHVVAMGDGLSAIADPYSEANALRAGEGFATYGFRANAGLPDICFGNLFPNPEMRTSTANPNSCVYTHYPPGPDWIVGIMTMLFGKGQIARFRLFPLLVGGASMAFLGASLIRVLGAFRGGVTMYAMSFPPMFSNMMHGLHYQGIAFALLLVQLGVTLRACARGHGASPRGLALYGLIAFVQGWLSFDYVFLVALLPVPIFLADDATQGRARARGIALAVVVCGGAFALAHAIHFLQVVRYLGGIANAVKDLRGAATRYASAGPLEVWPSYWLERAPSERYFGFNLLRITALTAITVALGRRGKLPGFRPPATALGALGASILVAMMWVTAMPAHGVIHGHFLPRHLFIVYATVLVILARSLRDPLTHRSGA